MNRYEVAEFALSLGNDAEHEGQKMADFTSEFRVLNGVRFTAGSRPQKSAMAFIKSCALKSL